MVVSVTNLSAITMCNAAVDACDIGVLNPNPVLIVYDGTPPALVSDALSGNNVLSQSDMSNTAFGDAVDINPGARATANAISDDAAITGGTASFWRIENREGNAALQGGVTATGGGGELEVNSIFFQTGVALGISSLTITQLEG